MYVEKVKHGRTQVVRTYLDNMGEVAEYARVSEEEVAGTMASAIEMRSRRDNWLANCTRDDCQEMAAHGWPEGAAEVARQNAEMILDADGGAVFEHHLMGGVPDVSRFLGGNPFNMMRPILGDSPQPVVRMVIDVSANAYIEGTVMARRAAAVTALIDSLAMVGVEMDLWAVMHTNNHEETTECVQFVNIKPTGAPLDLGAVAYGLGHPGMFRVQGFGCWNRVFMDHGARWKYAAMGGRGCVMGTPITGLGRLEDDNIRTEVVGPLKSNVFDADYWIKQMLDSICGDLVR